MANISITSQCNLDCSYCFAKDARMKGQRDRQHMTPDIYRLALDFIKRSGIKEIRILGGEPTLHPDFIYFIERALDTGNPVRIFTNGNIPARIIDFLETIPDRNLNIVLNITRLSEMPLETQPALEQTMTGLHSKIIPGINIFSRNVNPDFVFKLIDDFGLRNLVRIGLAHPCIGYENRHLKPGHYFRAGEKITQFVKDAGERNIQLIYDCGIVPCMFDYKDAQIFHKDNSPEFHCEPVPDILQDGSIVPCFSLSCVMKMGLDDEKKSADIRNEMIREIKEYKNFGIFKICADCIHKTNGFCSGGCAAQKIVCSNAAGPV